MEFPPPPTDLLSSFGASYDKIEVEQSQVGGAPRKGGIFYSISSAV